MATARGRRRLAAFVMASALLLGAGAAGAHSGGLDADGGHFCQQAGYEAGTCSPLGSYHCHQSPCGEDEHDHDGYVPVPSATTGETMRARRMFIKLGNAPERRARRYARAKFPHWIDANRDGCDTRQAVLISESRVRATRTADCTVTSGRWLSVYDGRRWSNPADVDIDHVVALGEAWRSGAFGWSAGTRRRFANDVHFRPSLRAVTDNVNQSKGDRDPSDWLPSKSRCQYAINWVQVKYRWRLKANYAERVALERILRDGCGSRAVAVPRRAR